MRKPTHLAVVVMLTVPITIGLPATAIAAAAVKKPKPHLTMVPRSPSGPPLSVNSIDGQESSASAPPSGEDSLASNGLDSPFCHSHDELSRSARQNCETADFIAGPDPGGDYAFDVNINTGVGALSNNISATIQNIAEWIWMTFVSVTHGLIVMLEWCYSLDLLSGPLLSDVAHVLHELRASLTEPWLVLVLSGAAVLTVYHGLLRRRIGETLGQTLLMFAMMVTGLWIIADPVDTVGALAGWADRSALGTLATATSGAPKHPESALASGMQKLFQGAVLAPWCYLEFGEVEWCRNPSMLDGRLRDAALVIARHQQAQGDCKGKCSSKAKMLTASATLLRAAQNNAELFLALPADGVERNSVTTRGALLNVLCGGGGSADNCNGATAAQAEFRTEKGTQSRVIGLCLILAGGLGMLLLFGFIVLRLLTAALLTLLYLLLAPVVVLLPALGQSGRDAFSSWVRHLLEAAASKLIYSFLLGAVLMLTGALLSLTMLGWFAQWLLIAAFWWGAFLRRKLLLDLINGSARRIYQLDRSRSFGRRFRKNTHTAATTLLRKFGAQ